MTDPTSVRLICCICGSRPVPDVPFPPLFDKGTDRVKCDCGTEYNVEITSDAVVMVLIHENGE